MENLTAQFQKIAKGDFETPPCSILKAHDLRQAVAIEALNHDNIKIFFSDLLQHGCICGMIGELIYYYDTHKFFNRFYDEIEELRNDYHDQTGEMLIPPPNHDLKNWLAWYGFEETAYQLASEFNLT